jgi:signal transduction histidine kinase/DNA-binding response OmpR family regulator
MPNPLRLLMIEDDENDELLLSRELIRAGYDLEYERVCTREDVERACAREWDIAITDWAMPNLSGLDAFRIVHARLPDLPVIMVSGTIGEDVAVSALKAGVDDFMTKGKFARLVPAIERVRRDAVTRHEKREADKALEQQRQELERSERLLRAVLGSVPDGVLVANHKHELLACNPAARSLLKLTPADTHYDAVNRSLRFFQNDRVTPLGDDSPLLKALGGEVVSGQEIVAKSLDGTESWHFSKSARPLADSSGISAAVVTFRDITQERATHEQLMVSDRMASVGMLAAGVAHEINNPLAAVIANLDLMAEVVTEEDAVLHADDVRELLDDARVAADRVRQIVRDLKIFSRHEDGGDGIVDIRHVLESTARMAWNEIRHRARLVNDFGDTPPVRGSESRLGQVFLNLLVNAAQAIPEGAAQRNTIRIATRGSGSNVLIEVSDTGSGMSLETQRRLFTPFFTTKKVGEGTGLGLAIAYRIVSALGGTIEVQSELGQGTTFRVCLPTTEKTPVAPSQPLQRVAATRRGRILVIDDEVAMCNVIRRMLSRRHEVHVTSRAVEALERIRAGETFDIILCDLMMPQMTGMELHAQLTPLGHADRIVFMSGGAFTPASRQFLDSVPNQRIEKPFDARHLEAIIERRLRT